MSPRVALLAGLAFVLASGLTQVGPASAADPFYESLMETGISAHARGDDATAAVDLRLASFGLLEEPDKLAECLTYLAVAQAEIGDGPELARTIDRLLEVERRFQAFSALTLDAGLRQILEGHLLTWIPSRVLYRSEVFRDVGRRKRQVEIRDMPPAERREELERLLAAEPGYAPWRLLLAELDFTEGDFAAALSSAERLLQQAPQTAGARCLRGRSGAALGRCEQALLDLEACDAPLDTGLLEQRLRCHLALQDFAAASGVLAQVSDADRQRQPFRQLAKEIEQGRKAAGRAAAAAQKATAAAAGDLSAAPSTTDALPAGPPAEDVSEVEAGDPAPDAAEPQLAADEPPAPESPPAAPPPAAVAQEADPPAAPSPSAASPGTDDRLRAELARLEALAQAPSRAELEAAFAAARELADSRPDLVEPQRLAAVIAFRLSRWQDVVTYSRRAGEPETPDRGFYLAVALYETGDRVAAREMLERCLPMLEKTDFVRGYAEKILGGE